MTTIGFIGSGKIGSALARLAVAGGHDVVLSNSRGPQTLADLVAGLGPRARAATVEEAATAGDLVVVTIPLRAYREVPVAPLAGKIVIDTNNYYPARDGHIGELDDGTFTSSGLLQSHLTSSLVVKVFNSIQFEELAHDGLPQGTANRRALPVAGDDAAAKSTVFALIDGFGYDPVDAGPLADSWRFEPGTPAYGSRLDAAGLTEALAEAEPWAAQRS